jgi:alanyl-tRNA synthetase
MNPLQTITQPIQQEFDNFVSLFNNTLSHSDGLLESVLSHIRKQGGKRMRPILLMLMAKNYGAVTEVTQYAAVGLELLHTASLVHDDVVDESEERRGQASVNASDDVQVVNHATENGADDADVHIVGYGNVEGHTAVALDLDNDGQADVAIIDVDDSGNLSNPDVVVDGNGNMATYGDIVNTPEPNLSASMENPDVAPDMPDYMNDADMGTLV